MNVFQKSLLILAPLSPYLMNLPTPGDSVSHWSVGLAAGVGSMADVSRDCEGHVLSVQDYQFSEVAGAIRYTSEPFTASVSAGSSTAWMEQPKYDPTRFDMPNPWTNRESKAVTYLIPTFGIDTKYFGLEAGVLTTLGEGQGLTFGPDEELSSFPAGSIRVGNREKTHFSAGVARNIPLISGGGLIDLGMGTPLGENGSRLFFGIGGGPYDRPILSLRGDLNLGDHFILTPRIGAKFGDAFEYGVSIGGWVRF